MLIRSVLLLALSIKFISSSSLFKDEEKRIMTQYYEKSFYSNGFSHSNFLLPVEPILSLDPIVFLREMRKVVDDIFLITFWFSFRSHWFFSYKKNSSRKPGGILAEITLKETNNLIARDMLYHFKVYLMQVLATYQGDKTEIMFAANEFYEFRLKALIEKVLNWRGTIIVEKEIYEMKQNFRFYYHCIEKDNFKSMLIYEFHMLKLAIKSESEKLISKHTENMTFLAGILKHDRSSVFGLALISDRPPDFVRYFLLMQYHQYFLLRGNPFLIKEEYKLYQIEQLHDTIPIFSVYNASVYSKFTLSLKFVNAYEDILGDDDLTNLARTIFNKIILFK
jgi:hypothetical protein